MFNLLLFSMVFRIWFIIIVLTNQLQAGVKIHLMYDVPPAWKTNLLTCSYFFPLFYVPKNNVTFLKYLHNEFRSYSYSKTDVSFILWEKNSALNICFIVLRKVYQEDKKKRKLYASGARIFTFSYFNLSSSLHRKRL